MCLHYLQINDQHYAFVTNCARFAINPFYVSEDVMDTRIKAGRRLCILLKISAE